MTRTLTRAQRLRVERAREAAARRVAPDQQNGGVVGDELVAFLRARLDEDEQAARAAHYQGQRWISEEEDVCRWPDDELVHVADRKRDAAHIARHDPARVLREVEAKRRIIGLLTYHGAHDDGTPDVIGSGGYGECWLDVTRLLALPYADHPDCEEEWRP